MFGASILDDGVDQVIVPLNPSFHYNSSAILGTNQDPLVPVTIVVPPTDRDEDAKQEDLGLTELLLVANAKREVITLLKLSLPIVLSNLAQLFLLIPMTAAIGKLGTIALASMNLVSIYAGVGGVALLSGLPFALDSLCSQAYTAAKDRRLLGIYLQRILVATMIVSASIYPLWWYSPDIFKSLGVPSAVAEVTGKVLRPYFFALVLLITYECLKSFLFAQGIRRFAIIVQIIGLPVGWLCIWFLISNPSTSLGILGVPWVLIVVGSGFNIIVLVFISVFDGHQCWGGWSRAAFSGLGPVFKLSAAGSAIAFFESVSQHMVDFGALLLDAPSMAAQTVLSMIANSVSGIGIGFAVSACNRVGHLLGLGQPNRTLLTVYVTVGLATVMFVAMGLAIIASRSKIPGVFTPDAEVADILFAHIPWAAASGVVTGVNLAFNGILRGQGRQAMVARIRALSVVCIGFPLGAFSMYVLKWRLAGLWFGHLISLIVALLAQVYVVATTNWAQESENCQARVSDAMLENGAHIGRASDL